jgi:uncharacterized protein (TIGR03382 family)
MLCTGPCDAGATCPHGFACESAGAGSVCWPSKSGGCATTSPQSSIAIVFALLVLRRRRR